MKISEPIFTVKNHPLVPRRAPAVAPKTIGGTGISGFITDETGRALWRELHLRAIEREGQEDAAWLDAFMRRVPCGSCRKHWMEAVNRSQVDWNNYFQWSVARHNEINVQLRKPTMQFTKDEYLALHAH